MLPPKRPVRKIQDHSPPFWVEDNAVFFLTINCKNRRTNQLACDKSAEGIIDGWKFYREQGRCVPEIVMVMPDHIHLLISFDWNEGNSMGKIVESCKRFTARKHAIQWQNGFFDHRIRNEEDLQQKWDYIINNPFNAGLVKASKDWPYIWINTNIDP